MTRTILVDRTITIRSSGTFFAHVTCSTVKVRSAGRQSDVRVYKQTRQLSLHLDCRGLFFTFDPEGAGEKQMVQELS